MNDNESNYLMFIELLMVILIVGILCAISLSNQTKVILFLLPKFFRISKIDFFSV